ncbi:MAG: TetR/AcrR family transcriptional regulator [Bacillota bacterium]
MQIDTQGKTGNQTPSAPEIYNENDTVNRRERLLLSAKHEMASVGYERASLEAIASGASLPPSELHIHFSGKPEMLEAVFNSVWEPLNSRIADIVMASVSTRHAVMAVLSAILHILDRDEDLARLLLFESRRQHGNNAEIRQSKGFRDFTSLLAHVVERGQKDGSFITSLRAPVIASALLGTAEGMIRDRMIALMLGESIPFTESDLRVAFEAAVSGFAP